MKKKKFGEAPNNYKKIFFLSIPYTNFFFSAPRKMPRKRPRNPKKRKAAEYEQDPELRWASKKRSQKAIDRLKDEEEKGGRTPKDFERLINMSNMATKKGQNKDSNDGKSQQERGRRKNNTKASSTKKNSDAEELKIQPGERMADFARRVDQALPMVKARSGSPSRVDKKRQKQREKALRQAEQRRKEKGIDEDEDELDQQQKDEEGTLGKRKGKRASSPDPWANIQAKQEPPKFGEVADRPPDLKNPTKRMNNVPKSAGSMARRHMLEDERNRFIERYRALIEQKNNGSNDDSNKALE